MNPVLKSFLASILVVVSGCVVDASDDDDDNENPTPTPGATATPAPTPNPRADPQSGVWAYSEFAASSNSCNTEALVTNGGGLFGLANNGNGTLTITPNDETAPFPCTVSAGSYSCPTRAAGTYEDNLLDATLHAQASVTGSFAADTVMSGTQFADVTCSGTECGELAASLGTSFPCQFEVDFAASWQY